MFFKKLLKLPGPADLGKSTSNNALASRYFSPDTTGYCWEDYEADIQKLYPIRYFILYTLHDFLKYKIWFKIYKPIDDLYYFIISHIIPGKRHHMLDLRQPCNNKSEYDYIDCYRYGWRDVPEKMLYAMFNLLKKYLDEEPYDLIKDYTLEQINADLGFKQQYDQLQEARELYKWWSIDRKNDYEKQSDLLHKWCQTNKIKEFRVSGAADSAYEKYKQSEIAFDNKTEEMLLRLLKIRRNLWT